MIKYVCDICGRELNENGLVYDVQIEIKAKYNKLEISLSDLLADHMDEIKEIIRKAKNITAEKLQNDVYKSFSFHLCPNCQQLYIADPLGQNENSPHTGRELFGDN